jgi:serine phosphatase RsbU (regulator of sigma subunit)
MMMTQTSIFTTVNRTAGYKPSSVLNIVNSVIKENINRLGTDRYMTISAIRLDHDKLVFAGKHQDILIHRARHGRTEFVPSKGTWIGILDDIGDYLEDTTIPIEDGDLVVLYTDGLTEATDARGDMFGELRLQQSLARHADRSPGEIVRAILHEVGEHMAIQRDDITLIVLKRTDEL